MHPLVQIQAFGNPLEFSTCAFSKLRLPTACTRRASEAIPMALTFLRAIPAKREQIGGWRLVPQVYEYWTCEEHGVKSVPDSDVKTLSKLCKLMLI
jgi:hypothetical protein